MEQNLSARKSGKKDSGSDLTPIKSYIKNINQGFQMNSYHKQNSLNSKRKQQIKRKIHDNKPLFKIPS